MTIFAKFALVALLGTTLTQAVPQEAVAYAAPAVLIGSFSGSVGSLAGM